MVMTALPFPPSYSSLSAISSNLSAPIEMDSRGDEYLVHGEQAWPVSFSVLWLPLTKEEALDQA